MICDPHLFFAEVSLDIARGEYRTAHDKLSTLDGGFPESYVLHLLHARASRGMTEYDTAMKHLRKCCRIAPSNEVAWQELVEVTGLQSENPASEKQPVFDPVADEFERLSLALAGFQAPLSSECSDPTPIAEQKQPFSDDASIAVPTESLANLFIEQGAYKKAIRVYTSLIQLKPAKADEYRRCIDILLDKL
jgi:tetratricopeptide (TPR) repeat protein